VRESAHGNVIYCLRNEKCTTLLSCLDCLVMELIQWKNFLVFVAICSMHIIGPLVVHLKSNIVKTNTESVTNFLQGMLRKHWSDNLKYRWRIERASKN